MNKTDCVRIDTLPLDDQARFASWLFRQTRPVVPAEIDATGQPAACANAWDYARWLSENKPTALSDPYAT